MKRFAWLLALMVLPVLSEAQTSFRYVFTFTDKADTPFSLDQPLEFLSQRALDRRQRQQIPLDSTDLPINPAYVQAVLAEGAIYLTHSKWLNSVTVNVVNEANRDAILNLPFVVGGVPVGKRSDSSFKLDKFQPIAVQKSLSEEERFSKSDYGPGFNQIDMLGGVSMHNQGFRGEGMLIAVLDAGFTNVNTLAAFDSLRNDGRLLGGWDFVDRNNTIYENHSHGTSVLSTMATYLPGQFIGTAPKASYLLCRTEDGGSEFPVELDYWIAGAEFADSAGADIINSSLGYTTFEDSSLDFTYQDMDGNTTRGTRGADMAASKGILVVNSAGNSGAGPWKYIGAPADGDSVLAIGAVNEEGFIANFSSEGPSSDGDIKPNVCAQGYQSTIVNTSGVVTTGIGTSFAGPIMAGMAACLWQPHKDSLTNMDIFHAIEKSAHQYASPDGFYGYGIPNIAKAHLMLSGLNPNDPEQSELLPVYPNPFHDRFQGIFYSSERQDVVIRLVNNLGQEVRRVEAVTKELSGARFSFNNLEYLQEGLYTLQIESDSGKYHSKLVKVRD